MSDPSESSANARARISALKSEWDRVRELSPENDTRLWRKLRLDWNYHSNHIEGNTLTYGETELLLISGKTTGQHDIREFEEMKAHEVAIQHVRGLAADTSRQLIEGDVRDLNKILLKEPFWKEAIAPSGAPTRKQIIPGDYKTTPNNVLTATGEIFHFSTPEETPAQMQELVAWFREQLESAEADLIRVLALFHHRFSIIHPFDDGNGRTMRLLVNYALMRKGWLPIIIRTEDKKTYLGALSAADAGNLQPFVEFLELQVERSLELGLKAARGESLVEPEDWQKEMKLFVREQSVEETPAPPRDFDLMKRWMVETIFPLANAILGKLAPLRKLFHSCKCVLEVADGTIALTEDLAGDLPEMGGWENQILDSLLMGYRDNLQLHFELRGFSNPRVTPFDVDSSIMITLAQYRFTLQASVMVLPITNLRYDAPLEPKLLESISSQVARHLFEQVKDRAEANAA